MQGITFSKCEALFVSGEIARVVDHAQKLAPADKFQQFQDLKDEANENHYTFTIFLGAGAIGIGGIFSGAIGPVVGSVLIGGSVLGTSFSLVRLYGIASALQKKIDEVFVVQVKKAQ